MDKVPSSSPAEPLRASPSVRPPAREDRDKNGAPGKRKDVRYPVSATAEVIEGRSRTRLSARASDLSLSGCYLDAVNIFPVATAVALRLTSENRTFECEARVVYTLSGMGMGLAFTKISPAQAPKLRDWIAELSGEADATAPLEGGLEFESIEPRPPERQNSNGSQDVLTDLISLLQRKGVLNESEANTFRNRITR